MLQEPTFTQLDLEYQEFLAFTHKYTKQYATESEAEERFRIFQENLGYIRAHNAGGKSWSLGVNTFTDLTLPEFRDLYLPRTLDRPQQSPDAFKSTKRIEDMPNYVDWREKKAVTHVKNQGMCGSCWAFSATGSVEGINAITTGTLLALSEQQLIDCSGSFGNMGCNGGLMDYAFQYIIQNGITTEANYPYTGVQGTCDTDKIKDPIVHIKSFSDVTQDSYMDLLAAVDMQPVSVAVDAANTDWQFYTSGVIEGTNCGTELDHGVLVVGYDMIVNQHHYWVVKNSWGADWGLDGYVHIGIDPQNSKGVCGINMAPSFPRE